MPSHISPCRLQMPGRLPLQCTSAVHRDFLMSSRTWQTRTDQQIHDNPIDAHHGWGSPGRQAAFSPRPCHGHYLLPSGCHGSQPSMWQTMPRHEKDAWNRCKSHKKICFQDMLQRHCRWLGVQSRSRCLLLDCCSGCLQGSGFVTLSCRVGCRRVLRLRLPGGPVLQCNLRATKLQAATAKAFQRHATNLFLRLGETGNLGLGSR